MPDEIRIPTIERARIEYQRHPEQLWVVFHDTGHDPAQFVAILVDGAGENPGGRGEVFGKNRRVSDVHPDCITVFSQKARRHRFGFRQVGLPHQCLSRQGNGRQSESEAYRCQ
ncbi:hypothetical protein [Neorhizobium lilium]|uniref:hypothetical protein n=1 Tax=Neorhizobium lilium TaxID=2503024 RepID=UPI0013E2B610|nr:hypothetical protein [Neorhizobium lilium]